MTQRSGGRPPLAAAMQPAAELVPANASQSDAAAIERAAWFEREVVALLPDLLGAALRLEKNRADAEDLVAECVARAWSRLPTLRDASAFRGWMFRILSNRFISECRARGTRVELPLEESDAVGEDFSLFARLHAPILLWWSNPEQEFLDRLLREDLERAVDALPECFRIVVVLVDLQGFSYQDAAAALDVPIGTVRSRLARGRSLLQKSLWLHAQDAGMRPADDATGHTTPQTMTKP